MILRRTRSAGFEKLQKSGRWKLEATPQNEWRIVELDRCTKTLQKWIHWYQHLVTATISILFHKNGNGRGSSRSSGGWGYRCRAPPCGLNFSLIWKKKGDRRSWVNMGSEQVQLKGRLNGRNRRSSDGVVSQRRQQRNYSTGWWMCQGLALQIAGGSATPKSRVIKIENHAHRL